MLRNFEHFTGLRTVPRCTRSGTGRSGGVPGQRHTIRLTLLAEKNPASKDRYANITGFHVAITPGNSPGSLPSAVNH